MRSPICPSGACLAGADSGFVLARLQHVPKTGDPVEGFVTLSRITAEA
jgi:hypothetical protein